MRKEAEVLLMLQSLLEDRSKLLLRRETKQLPVYELNFFLREEVGPLHSPKGVMKTVCPNRSPFQVKPSSRNPTAERTGISLLLSFLALVNGTHLLAQNTRPSIHLAD